MKNLFSALAIAVLAFSSSAFAADSTNQPTATPAVTASVAKPAVNLQQDVVNINTADAQTLTKLKGIGMKKAEAIVAWRKANGNFKTIDQLAEVKGIGPKMVEALRQQIRI